MSNIINSVRPTMDQTRSGNRASERNFFLNDNWILLYINSKSFLILCLQSNLSVRRYKTTHWLDTIACLVVDDDKILVVRASTIHNTSLSRQHWFFKSPSFSISFSISVRGGWRSVRGEGVEVLKKPETFIAIFCHIIRISCPPYLPNLYWRLNKNSHLGKGVSR